MSEHVWVIESGEYEDRMIFGIAATRNDAVAYIKSQYGEPYIVEWMPLDGDERGYTLRGHFERVEGYSAGRVGEFDITPHDLIAGLPRPPS